MFEFKLPDIGEGVHEGEIAKWHVSVGQTIADDAPMVEVMTDKVTVEITSPTEGVVTEILYDEGAQVKVGAVIIKIDPNATGAQPATKTEPQTKELVSVGASSAKTETTAHAGPVVMTQPVAQASVQNTGKVLAPPAVRKLAREQGINLSQVQGSGPKGRIRKQDLVSLPQQVMPVGNVGNLAPVAAPKTAVIKQDRAIPFRGIRRKIAEHLVKSKQTAPHFTYVEEADLTELIACREQLKSLAKDQDVKLTYLPFIIKAVVEGLKRFEILNSSLDDAQQEIIIKGQYNIGVAVATDNGLVVPVIHNADQMGLFEISKKLEELSQLARSNKLPLEAMQGGTFTITSIGSIGGIFSAPIINYPEVAIMGIQKVEKRPVVRNDEIVIRQMCYLSISCDHRVVDGAEAAYFMKEVIELLQSPYKLLALSSQGVL